MARQRRPRPADPAAGSTPGGPEADIAGDGATGPSPSPGKRQRAIPRTRAATVWTSLIVALVLLVVALIFIFQNLQSTRISFFTLHGRYPLAAALVFAAVLGALFVVCLSGVRILQLRIQARRNLKAQPTTTRTR